ncbi:MAG: low temperature requirement protein A [Mogibacterium sp.]|nr:low temperature requirement protein A [Mogibacterium sp.]
MLSFIKEEKKVEYLELIYDLVFVYMIGRNNALLGHFEGGFVSANAFIAYILCTLAIIQIWSFTTFYINMFGRNGVRDHVFLCINMYLMFYIGQATRLDWAAYQMQYHIAWALILINIGLQYVVELRNHQMDVWNRDIIKWLAATLFLESAVALSAAFVPESLVAPLSFAAVGIGILLTSAGKKKSPGNIVDFSHLTERAMLYVVFTFGEMIIEISSYFVSDGSFSWNVLYYSMMGFLIVVGLFMSYEMIYDHLLDRDKEDNGLFYMLIHIFIIFGLNNITASLEFMREEEVALVPKMVFLVVSVIIYYGFLFSTGKYAKKTCRFNRAFILKLAAATAGFALLMMLFRETPAAHIFITVLYVWGIFIVLWRAAIEVKEEESA